MNERPNLQLPESPEKHETIHELRLASHSITSPEHEKQGKPNEDAHYFNNKSGIIAVFDGLGGAPAGHLASRAARSVLDPEQANDLIQPFFEEISTPLTELAVKRAGQTLLKRMSNAISAIAAQPDPDLQRSILEYANKRYKKALKRELDPDNIADQGYLELAAGDIGTTVSMAKYWLDETGKKHLTTFQVGDSAVYRFRKGQLEKLTIDDSYITSLINSKLIVSEEEYTRQNPDPNALDYFEQTVSIDAIFNMQPVDLELIHIAKYQFAGLERISLHDIRHYLTLSMNSQPKGALAARVATHDVEDGDIFIAMTDGITDNLNLHEIRKVIAFKKDQPEEIPQLLAKLARERSLTLSLPREQQHPRAKFDDGTATLLAT